MQGTAGEQHDEVKMYSDFKSPYAYLAFDPSMALGQRFNVRVRWIQFQLRVKGKGERSVYSEYKVKYSYMDARRFAKPDTGSPEGLRYHPCRHRRPVCAEARQVP